MKKIMFFTFIITIFIISTGIVNAYSFTSVPGDVLDGAESSLQTIKNDPSITGDYKGWGFNSVDEINNLSLGEGFILYRINGDKFRKTNDWFDSLEPTQEWTFILNVYGKPKTIMGLELINGKYFYTHFGGDAAPLGQAFDTYNNFSVNNGNIKPIVFDGGPNYYLITRINGKEYIVPGISKIHSAEYNNMDNTQVIPAEKLTEYSKMLEKANKPGEMGGTDVSSANPPGSESKIKSGNWFSIIYIVIILIVLGICYFSINKYRLRNKMEAK